MAEPSDADGKFSGFDLQNDGCLVAVVAEVHVSVVGNDQLRRYILNVDAFENLRNPLDGGNRTPERPRLVEDVSAEHVGPRVTNSFPFPNGSEDSAPFEIAELLVRQAGFPRCFGSIEGDRVPVHKPNGAAGFEKKSRFPGTLFPTMKPENGAKDDSAVKPEWVKLIWDSDTPAEELAEHIVELLDEESADDS